MTDDQLVRENLKRLIRNSEGESYSSISRLIGRNVAYVQQFITRGTPDRLDERDRRVIARYFRVDQDTLGDLEGMPIVHVPKLSVEAAAGSGRYVEGEFLIGGYGFDERWLRAICAARPADLSIINVSGDSMSPTLADGDDVLVDGSGAARRLRDGIYVLRREDTLFVKRITIAPTTGAITVSSDNPAHPSWRDVPMSSVDVLGRVVWSGRRHG